MNPNVDLNWDMVRGLFDADGSICGSTVKITTGSPFMVEKLQNFYKKEGFLSSVYSKGNAKDIAFRFTTSSRCKIESTETKRRLFDKLYTNAEVFLERKRKSFLDII